MPSTPPPKQVNESSYEALVENLQCMVYRCMNTPELAMLFVSQACTRLLGLPAQALLSGQPHWGHLIHPEEQALVWDKLQTALAQGEPINLRYRVRDAQQQWRWVRQLGRGVFGDDGELIYLEGYVADITEYRQVAEALSKSEQFSNATLDALSAHIAILDANGTIVQTNEAWDQFPLANGGAPHRPPAGANYLHALLAVEDNSAQVSMQVAQAIQTILQGEPASFSIEFPCQAALETRWFFCHINPLPVDGTMFVVVSHEDISPIRQMEVALEASEAKLRNTFEHAAVGIAHIGPAGDLTQVNPHFCEILGYSAEELAHIRANEVTHPDDMALDQTNQQALLAGQIPSYTMEKRYLRKNGEIIWASVTASLLRDEFGLASNIVAIVENIHLRKLTDLAMQALNTKSNGEAFLQKITATLATLLGVEIAFVTVLGRSAQEQARTRALCIEGEFDNDFSFDFEGTACAAVLSEASPLFDEEINDAPLIVAEGAQERFPADLRLQNLGAQSYAGITLWNAVNSPLGTLAIMSRKSLRDPQAVTVLLQLLALRVGTELERENESRKFHDLFDSSPSAILMLDVQGTIHLTNKACEELFGWKATSLLGQEVGTLFPEEYYEAYMGMYQTFVQDGLSDPRQSVPQDVWAKRQDGTTFPTELFLSRLQTNSGVMTVAYVHDITERKKAQDRQRQLNQELEAKVLERTRDIEKANLALAYKEEEIRSVVENMVDAVIGFNEQGTIISANKALTTILGYAVDEVLGHNVSQLIPEPEGSAYGTFPERYTGTSESQATSQDQAVKGLHKNGQAIELEISVSEYLVRGTRFFTCSLRDIRERVHMIETLETAREEAEQANKAKSSFLATMSHEIRTPMNGVIGMIEILERSSLQNEQMETVRTIRESAHALLTIIDDVLDFSKIEAGQFHVDSAPMDLPRVVEGVCDTLDQLASNKGVELTLFTDPAIPQRVLGDDIRLRQVLLNLVGNAIKFCSGKESKGGRVYLRASVSTATAQAPAALVMQIVDNGIGMSPEAVSKLFSPFNQADNSTTRRFGGTGLGLSISRRLVELMNGSITVKSVQGKGSLFTVQLPLQTPAEPQEAADGGMGITGVNCVVLGKPAGMTADLLAYLRHGRAHVVQAGQTAELNNWLGSQPQGPWAIIMDGPLMDVALLRQHVHARQGLAVRFLRIERGKRRRPRLLEPDVVTLDGNVMHRRYFLEAVAMAVGRAADTGPRQTGEGKSLANAPAPLTQLLQGQHILVAEDNEVNQKVILKQLSLLGITADVGGDGSIAFERWKQGNYPLLLTDLHMPNMDGYELARAIRQAEAGARRMPILALTANAIKGEARECQEAGMDDYLTKPVQLNNLQTMLSKWLTPLSPTENRQEAPAMNLTEPTPTPEPEPASAPAWDPASVPVDVAVLKALVGDDPADIAEFLHDFRLSAVKTGAEIDAAFAAAEATQLGALAHKLKSSSRSVGALALGELCAQLEESGKNSAQQEIVGLIPKFRAENARVDAYLQSLGA